jgi:hypothetical protein
MFRKNKEGFHPVNLKKQKVFISISSGKERALTLNGIDPKLDPAFMKARSKVIRKVSSLGTMPKWIYMGFVEIESRVSLQEFYNDLNNTRKYYYRKGLAFDEDYQMSFLEQEINASALILYDKNLETPVLHDRNITDFLKRKQYSNKSFIFSSQNLKSVIVFECKSCFYEKKKVHSLSPTGLRKNIRAIMNTVDAKFIMPLIDQSGEYLRKTVKSNGAFVYGYFPCFDKEITTYNAIRHCLAVISLMKVYALSKNEKYKDAIQKSYKYFIENCVIELNKNLAIVVDKDNENEIRLGALGLSIVMILEYAEMFCKIEDISKAVKIGKFILTMQNKATGEFVHVLNYPNFKLKEKFKIVYYSGEACYGLLKLFTLTRNPQFLKASEKAFNFFIENHYEKYYDHWLAYASNELTQHIPQDKYYDFALKNAFIKIDFIKKRSTTWTTFLELLNSTFFTIERLKQENKLYLLKEYKIDYFYKTIWSRVLIQMNGIMYPEMAMFYKNPDRMIYGTFIRHHFFRVRNDDVAHHLIGYCNFVQNILSNPFFPVNIG